MTVTIYGDVLAAINFTVTLVLLRLCGIILGCRSGKIARILAAVLGAAASFIIFVPMGSVALQLLYRLAVSVLIIGVAFPSHSLRYLLRSIGVFYVTSFLMAGVVAALVWLFPAAGFCTANGAIYFNIRPLVLLGATAVAYGVISLYDRFTARRTAPQALYRLAITRKGETVRVFALADSGNNLTEPFSGLPVVVSDAASVWPLLNGEERRAVQEQDTISALPGMRWILCHTVTGETLLPAFRADHVIIAAGRDCYTADAYFAVTAQGIHSGSGYSALFNPKMIRILLEDRDPALCTVTGKL